MDKDFALVKAFFQVIYPMAGDYRYICPFCDTDYKFSEIEKDGSMNELKMLYELPHEIDCDFSKAYNAILRLEERLKQKVLREIQADIEQLRDEWNNSQITEWSKGILLSIQRELEDNLQKSE